MWRQQTGSAAWAVTAVLAAALMAGCGSLSPNGKAGGSPAGAASVRQVASLRQLASASQVANVGPPRGSRAEALRLARSLLARVRMPAGARLTTSPPAFLRRLVSPGGPLGPRTTVDAHRLWMVSQPTGRTVAFFCSHPPARMRQFDSGSGEGITELGYWPLSMPVGIYAAQVSINIVSDRHGGSVVWADAQVIWYPPRSKAEHISGMHAVTIRATASQVAPHWRTRTFTAAAVIARLARLVNGMPALPEPEPWPPCPSFDAAYSLAFASARGIPPSVVITGQYCPPGDSVTVNGKTQPVLRDSGEMLATTLAQLIGIRLS